MRRPSRRTALGGALAAIALAAVSGSVVWSSARQEGFPHAEHAGLFPTCVGCHAGVAAGDTAAFVTITPADCAGCHDGVDLDRVEWRGPEREPSNLDFSHPEHVAEIAARGEPALDCLVCHRAAGVELRMAVERTVVGACFSCHAPGIESHFAYRQLDCSTCHLPLVRAPALPVERVALFPRPVDHERPDFLFTHGEGARTETQDCAVCHARESCERCHLNADRLGPIAALARDSRVTAIVADRAGEWPEPPSHRRPDWEWRHGEMARAAIEGCANCHTADSCAACHQGETRPAVIAELPRARPDRPQGVLLVSARPTGHTVDFVLTHGAAAASGSPDCAACHTERQCLECHDGNRRPEFHPVDFVVRHAAEAFANDTECAACHSREAFCRDCHAGVGLSVSRTSGASSFHDAVPDWLIAHPLAARQDLEACTTCHEERSCLRCHSAKTGFRISPHGPDFDPDRTAGRSTQSCAICHFDLPAGVSP